MQHDTFLSPQSVENAGMSNTINLNQFRKQKAREERRAEADANAVKFGRTKAERQREAEAAERARQHLDAHRRDEE